MLMAGSPLIAHPGFSAHAPEAVAESRIDASESGKACLQVEDIDQALKFATQPAYVRWQRYAGVVDEKRVVGGVRDLPHQRQQAGLDAHAAGDPFGPDAGPRAGPQRIA